MENKVKSEAFFNEYSVLIPGYKGKIYVQIAPSHKNLIPTYFKEKRLHPFNWSICHADTKYHVLKPFITSLCIS